MPRTSILHTLKQRSNEQRPFISGILGASDPGKTDMLVACFGSSRPFSWEQAYRVVDNANEHLLANAGNLLHEAGDIPLLAGVCAFDPFISPEMLLHKIKEAGFDGVHNYPTVGLCDGRFRFSLERVGLSFQQDIQLMMLARKLDLFTLAMVFQAEEARLMAEAGVDALVLHLGLEWADAAQPVELAQRVLAEVRAIRPDIPLLFCGSCLEEAHLRDLFQQCGQGFHAVNSLVTVNPDGASARTGSCE